MKIKTKLNGFLVLISILPLLIVTQLHLRASEKSFTEQEFDHFTTAAELKKQDLDIWIEHLKRDFSAAVNQIGDELKTFEIGHKSGDDEESPDHQEKELNVKELLQWMTENHPIFSHFVVLKGDTGSVHLASDTREVHKIYSSEPFFIEGKKGLYLQGISYAPALGTSTMWIAEPVYDKENDVSWVIAARIDLEDLFLIMENRSGLGKTGETYLVNTYNQLIGQSRFLPGQQFIRVDSEGAKDCLAGNDGQGHYLDYRGQSVIGVYRWMEELNLCLLAEIDEAEVFASHRKLVLAIYLAIIGLALLLYSFSVYFTKSFMKPILKLTEVAKDIAGGNLKRRIPSAMMEKGDEIATLASAFDEMSETLANTLVNTQNIVSTMPSALFIINGKGEIIRTNKKAGELLKTPEKKLIGKDFFDYFSVASTHKGFDATELKPNKTINDIPGKLGRGRQKRIPVSLSGVPLQKMIKKGASDTNFILTAADLREQKRYAHSRVKEITPILNRISLGDFEAKLEAPKSNDEFADLIVAIDLMADNLRQLIRENREKTNELVKSHTILMKAKAETDHERAKAEALLSNIGEAVLAVNPDGKIIFVNQEAERAFGHRSSTASGKEFADLYRFELENGQVITPDQYPMSECVKKRKPIHTTSYFIRKNKRTPYSTTASPILRDNKLLGIVGTFRDITEEVAIDKSKSEFVSLASHQMRTPMTGIKWMIQAAMLQGNLNERQVEFLKDALSSNERMIRLVDDLLNVSRIDSGSIAFEPKENNLSKLVQNMIREHQTIAKNKDQKLILEKPKKDIIFSFDPLLVGEVISNLLSNAINYSGKGKPIKITLKKTGKSVSISVNDKGIGISPKEQKKLFTKFYRTDEASEYSTTGSGLGLYLVKQVIEVAGGTIKLDSKHGKGSTFTVTLPLKPPIGIKGKTLIKKKPTNE